MVETRVQTTVLAGAIDDCKSFRIAADLRQIAWRCGWAWVAGKVKIFAMGGKQMWTAKTLDRRVSGQRLTVA